MHRLPMLGSTRAVPRRRTVTGSSWPSDGRRKEAVPNLVEPLLGQGHPNSVFNQAHNSPECAQFSGRHHGNLLPAAVVD